MFEYEKQSIVYRRLFLLFINIDPSNSNVKKNYHYHQNHRSQQSLNCAASANPSSCCYGLDDAIATKAYNDFHSDIEKIMKISTFENHFIQYYNRIYWKLDQILNDTITDIDEYFGRTATNQQQDHRIVKANRNLIEFIRMVIFESRHHTAIQLNDHVDHLLEAIFIDILQQPHQNKFPNEYESCLLDTMKDSDILSKTRDEMLFRFSRTIDTARYVSNFFFVFVFVQSSRYYYDQNSRTHTNTNKHSTNSIKQTKKNTVCLICGERERELKCNKREFQGMMMAIGQIRSFSSPFRPID